MTDHKANAKTPVRRPRPVGLRWRPVLVAGVVVLCLSAAQVLALLRTPISTAHEFLGALSRKNQLVPVAVPDGAHILSVLVKEGSAVNVGQTVALIDPLPFESELETITRSQFSLRSAIKCLERISDIIDFEQIVPTATDQEPDKTNSERESQTQQAIDLCRNRQTQVALDLAKASADVTALLERVRLIKRALGVASSFALPSDGATGTRNTAQLRKTLELSLAVNLAQQELDNARQDYRELIVTQEKNRLQQLADMRRQLHENANRQAVLDRAIADLRLYAPITGTVTDLRKAAAGSVFYNGDSLFEIVPSGSPHYETEFILPVELVPRLPLGTRVRLRVKGLTQVPPPLLGEITRFSYETTPDGGHQITGHVRLTAQSILALENKTFGLARLSNNVAMSVEVKILKDSLWQDATTGVLQQGHLTGLIVWFRRMNTDLPPVVALFTDRALDHNAGDP